MSKFLDETGLSYFWEKVKAALSTVAFTGSYNDLSNKPNIPASSTVDTALSSTSTNPVQNKVINTALGTKANDSDVVKLTGDQTIAGTKTFSNTITIGSNQSIARSVNNQEVQVCGGTNISNGGTFFVWGKDKATDVYKGAFVCRATLDGTTKYDLHGKPDGTLTWGGKSFVYTSGNQTIANFKVFTDTVRSTGSAFSLIDQTSVKGTIPSADKSQYIYFFDKVDDPQASSLGTAHVMACLKHLYAKTSGNNSLQLIVYTPTTGGTANKLLSFRATPAGAYAFLPGTNNDIDLGSSSNKWANVYATTFTGNVTGNCSGTSSNVTGTIAIANGGTGATSRLAALKALTNESVGTSANYFLTITSSWGKGGYTSVADAKTVLGLKSAAYTESSAYATSSHALSVTTSGDGNAVTGITVSKHSITVLKSLDFATADHTHSYLPLTGGTLTGMLSQKCAVPTYNCFDTDLTKGTNPSSAQWLGLLFCDKTGNSGTKYRAGAVETSVTTTGETQTYLRAYNWKANTTTEEHIAICYPKDGTPYTIAPTPATSDNSTKIATTAYVKAQGYITSSGSITGSSGSCTGNSNTATTATYLSVPTYTGDLNALETSGVYYVNDGTNYPVGSNGQVIVIKKGNFIRQFFFRAGTINSNEHQNYSREKNISTGEWGDWYWFVNSKQLPLSIARGGTGSETRLDAVKALLNESVTSPDYFLGITTSWAKGGYVSIANAKTALGVNIYANIKIGHIKGGATYTLPSGGTWAWALIKDGRGTPSKAGSNAGGTVLKNDWDTDWGAVYIAVRTA